MKKSKYFQRGIPSISGTSWGKYSLEIHIFLHCLNWDLYSLLWQYLNTRHLKIRLVRPHLETGLLCNINHTTRWMNFFIISCCSNLLGLSLSDKALPDPYGTAEWFCCSPMWYFPHHRLSLGWYIFLFHATTAVFSPFYICPFCSWCEFWVFSPPVSLYLVTKPQSHHSLCC